MSSKDDRSLPGRTFPQYFTELAASYSRSTGDSTYKVIEKYLQTAQPPAVDTTSIINDNACGPGTVSTAVITRLGTEPAQIEANDCVPAMVEATSRRIEALGWKNVTVSEMDSSALVYCDNTFTVSISNISVTNYQDPQKCLTEMHRTLRPDGLAVVSIWKRFGAAEVIHAAQKSVRADSELMKVPKSEFMQEGYLSNLITTVGFKSVETNVVSVVCKGEEIEGLRSFVLGDFTRVARAQWTEAEQVQWPDAVDRAIQDETSKFGGIRFDAWVVTGRK